MTSRVPRSYLYVPGNVERMLAKATGRGADALIVDLEDAVPPAEKDAARESVAAWLREQAHDDGVELWVRVNPAERGIDDVLALAGLSSLTGLVLAKADADAVARVDTVLGGVAGAGGVRLMPLLETAAAVLDARTVAAGPRVHRLQVGEVDLTSELGMNPGPDEAELLAIRTTVVLASLAAGIEPPVGPVSRLTSDSEGLADSTRRIARLGYQGRACVHPEQVPVVHEVFTPSAERVSDARATLRLLAEAEAQGSGVAVDAQGHLVDRAIVRSAERVLALHEQASGDDHH